MSIFRYNSNHKAIVGILIVLVSALGFYLRDREKPKHSNGQAKQVGSQLDGRNHGLWVWYFSNGKREMQGNFTHGKREGIWITFAPNGDTLIRASYQNDKLNGQYTVYGADNTVKDILFYEQDKLLSGNQK